MHQDSITLNPVIDPAKNLTSLHRRMTFRARRLLRTKLGPTLAVAIGSVGMALQARAQSDPFSTTATTVETMLTGTFAKVFVVIVMVLAGVPIAMGSAGDHKGKLVGTVVGCVLILGAQSVITWLGIS